MAHFVGLPSAAARPRAFVDRSIALAPRRVKASRKSPLSIEAAAILASDSASALGAESSGRLAFSGGSGPCLKATFSTQRQPRCAFTLAAITATLCCASKANAPSNSQYEGCRGAKRVGIMPHRARWPQKLNWPGISRDAGADDRRPVGDQACLAEASRGERLNYDVGHEFRERLGAAASKRHDRAIGVECTEWTSM